MKIIDAISGEVAEFEECQSCQGMGGYDVSTDCEAYEDWHSCEECSGRGLLEAGFYDRDRFVPESDAWISND